MVENIAVSSHILERVIDLYHFKPGKTRTMVLPLESVFSPSLGDRMMIKRIINISKNNDSLVSENKTSNKK